MPAKTQATPAKALAATVAACRAALPRKRGVTLRLCFRRVLGERDGIENLSDPDWRTWDGTRRGLQDLLTAAGVENRSRAEAARITLHATHHAVSFHDALPASREVTDLVRQLLPE